jgi:hypothetical protein
LPPIRLGKLYAVSIAPPIVETSPEVVCGSIVRRLPTVRMRVARAPVNHARTHATHAVVSSARSLARSSAGAGVSRCCDNGDVENRVADRLGNKDSTRERRSLTCDAPPPENFTRPRTAAVVERGQWTDARLLHQTVRIFQYRR